MIKQECIGIPDMILLLMIFCFKKIKIKAEIVLSPGGAYFPQYAMNSLRFFNLIWLYLRCLLTLNSELQCLHLRRNELR